MEMISKQAVVDCIYEACNGMAPAEIINAINRLPSISDGWISCGDQLPEPRETVLVFTKYKSRLTGQVQLNEEWHIGVGDRRASDYVTHWQPLPNPPQK